MKALDDAAVLKDECIHPTSNLPYVRSFKAGKDNSKEGLQVYPNHPFYLLPFSCLLHVCVPNILLQQSR